MRAGFFLISIAIFMSCHTSKRYTSSTISLFENGLLKFDTLKGYYKTTLKELGTFSPKIVVLKMYKSKISCIVSGHVEFPPSLIFDTPNGSIKKRKLNAVSKYEIVFVRKEGEVYYVENITKFSSSSFKLNITKGLDQYFVLEVDGAPNKLLFDFKSILESLPSTR